MVNRILCLFSELWHDSSLVYMHESLNVVAERFISLTRILHKLGAAFFGYFSTAATLLNFALYMPYAPFASSCHMCFCTLSSSWTLRILAPYASYLRNFVYAFWMPSLHVLGALLTHLIYILFTSYLFVLKNLWGWICSLPKTLTFPSLLKTLQTVLIFCWLKENLES